MDAAATATASEPPPSLPASDYGLPAPATRSELLANRRAESRDYLQGSYDAWESANPVWAQRLTGPAAAAALGFNDHDVGTSRREMLHQRRINSRDMALRTSGFSDAVQQRLCEQEPGQLITSLSRPTQDPTTDWIDAPERGGSRSALMQERRQQLIDSLAAAA